MSQINLDEKQKDALKRMKNGCILCGGVGSGKSRTSLAYYYIQNGGDINLSEFVYMSSPKDLYIITTAKKRDTLEWEEEMIPFKISTKPNLSLYSHKVIVDSWNNIGKYSGVENSFFIFDEQRVVGYGKWVQAFLKIAKHNDWILLTATPGDTWSDYIPVFIANGFFKNKTEFVRNHIMYSRMCKYPKIDRYLNTYRLKTFRDKILVKMDYESPAEKHHIDVDVSYDKALYREVVKTRFDIFQNKPLKNAAEFCYLLRKIVNSDPSRELSILEIAERTDRIIIFYSFDYELDILRNINYGPGFVIAEWNGHKHQPIPDTDKWIYLVQYSSGCEGWNCTTTDTMIFYSQHYSYKVLTQAAGRIDRRTTNYKDLYYYHLKSRSSIDVSISRAIENKKIFSETGFCNF